MADTKISALSSGAPAQAGDEYVIARSGANYKLTLTNIAANMPATTVASGDLIVSSGNVGIGTASPGSLDPDADNLVVGGGSGNTGISIYSGNASGGRLMFADGTSGDGPYVGQIHYDHSSNYMRFITNGGERMRIDAAGKITDQYGTIRAIPRTGSAKTTSYTLATTDVGLFVEVGSGGSVTIPDATFATGDVVSIFNNTSGNITITCSITTAYIAGTDTDKATMTLATRGVATILFISGTVCVVNGNVS